MDNKPLHSGHRQRLKEKYIASDFDYFNDHEILELLLFYSIPRKDTNPEAHKLLNHFGSLSAVFDASYEELKDYGLSDKSAMLFRLFPTLSREYIYDKNYNTNKHYNEISLQKRLITCCIKRQKPALILSLYDAVGCELFFGPISLSGFDSMKERITQLAMKYNAVSAVVCTENNTGIPYPSYEETVKMTIISEMLHHINISFENWFVVSETNIASMRDKKEFASMFRNKNE